MKILKILDKVVEYVSNGALLLSGILLLAMGINVTYGVVTRYVFNSPSIIAIEMTKILMIPALVLAVSYVQRNNRHLRVDFLSNRFSQTAQNIILEIFVPITGLCVGYILVWKGWDSAMYSLQTHERSMSVWSEPLFPVRIMIPIGYGLLCLVMIAQLFKGIGRLLGVKTKGQPETPEAKKTAES
jgi:C4-dicarboxylate transporter, DctQ subunit